jgi:hypothetical protein
MSEMTPSTRQNLEREARAALGDRAEQHEIRRYVEWLWRRRQAAQTEAAAKRAEAEQRRARGQFFTVEQTAPDAVRSTPLTGRAGDRRAPREVSPDANLEVLADSQNRYAASRGPLDKRINLEHVLPEDAFIDRLSEALDGAAA